MRIASGGHGREPADVRKTSQRLADDREIIYYDSAAVGLRQAKDSRVIGPVTVSSELRRDPLLGMWVMYASHRQDRTYLPAERDCPLCPSTDDHLTEVPEHDYEVVVFENRFPALKAPPLETVRAETVRAEQAIGAPGRLHRGFPARRTPWRRAL